MATGRNISQNKPFANQKNSRSRLGPTYYDWEQLPFQKTTKRGPGIVGTVRDICCCGKVIVSDSFGLIIGDNNSTIIWN